MHSAFFTIYASAARSSWVTAAEVCSDSALPELILILIQSCRVLKWQMHDVYKSCTYFRICTKSNNNIGFAEMSLHCSLSRKNLSSTHWLQFTVYVCLGLYIITKYFWVCLSDFLYCNILNKTDGFMKTISCILDLQKLSYEVIVEGVVLGLVDKWFLI